MSKINFPNEPELNEIFIIKDIIYKWNGVSWVSTNKMYYPIFEYSIDGETDWSNEYVEGHLYIRISTDDGITWTEPFKFIGDDGLQGIQGSQGLTGTQGTTGAQGTTGTQGTTGLQGTTGAQGTTGETGIQGIQGLTGSQGETGAQGTTGETGVQGIQGLTGSQGETGLQGTTGETGIQGIQGLTGSQGTTGLQGTTGTQGTTGLQGTTGETGIQGIQGIQGLTGIQGLQGPMPSDYAPALLEETTEKTADYTLTDGDQNKIVLMNKTSAATLTVPTNNTTAFTIGTVIGVYNAASNPVTITGAGGVTIRNSGDLAQYGEISLRKRATNEWVLAGVVT